MKVFKGSVNVFRTFPLNNSNFFVKVAADRGCRDAIPPLSSSAAKRLAVFEHRFSLFNKCRHPFFLIFGCKQRMKHPPLK